MNFFKIIYVVLSLFVILACNKANGSNTEYVPWEGSYKADTYESRTYGGTGIGYEHFISIRIKGDCYAGVYEINGYQTCIRKKIIGKFDNEDPTALCIYIAEETDEEFDRLTKDSHICTMYYDTRSQSFTVCWEETLGGYINENTTFSKICAIAYDSSIEMSEKEHDIDYAEINDKIDTDIEHNSEQTSPQYSETNISTSNNVYIPQPVSISNIPEPEPIQHGTEKITCSACGGSGKGIDKIIWSPNYTGEPNDVYCSICGNTSSRHTHHQQRCQACYGKGYIEMRY